MNLDFFHTLLSVDSTSGREAELADILLVEFAALGRKVESFDVGAGAFAEAVADEGLLNLFVQHMSCALSINENADPDVRVDMATIYE